MDRHVCVGCFSSSFVGKNQAIYTSSICRMKRRRCRKYTYSLTTIGHDSLFTTAAAQMVGCCTVGGRREDME